MAELADAYGSGPYGRKALGVQLPPSAPKSSIKKGKVMKQKVSVSIIIIVLVQLFSLLVFGEEEETAIIKIPRYTILKNTLIDTPFKTLVEMDILIPDETTEKGLRWLLKKLYFSIMNKGTYRYNTQPTNVYIYVYSAYDRYTLDKSLRMAALKKHSDDIEPAIEINPLQVPSEEPELETEQKFGLTEEKRKAIWEELVGIEDKVFKTAQKNHVPLPTNEYLPSAASARLNKEVDSQGRILSLELQELGRKYGLTRKQLDEIVTEGIEKNWQYSKN